MSCRIVAERKSAKQRCRKLAVKDWLGRHLLGRQRNTLGAWCGQVVEAAGSLRVRMRALVKGVRQINANGWPTARDGQRGEC